MLCDFETSFVIIIDFCCCNLSIYSISAIDSSSHLQSGYLEGNIINYGDFEECMKVTSLNNKIHGQYCTVEFDVKNIKDPIGNKTYTAIYHMSTMALCLPSSCQEGEVTIMMKNQLKTDPSVSCMRREDIVTKPKRSQYLIM